uniref:Uncharacterized protein n=1 Tax=Panagrolaimus davidi TaxID=227884 RepID=A0A914P028_9BILA
MVAEDIVNLNESINGHTITIGWLLESLRENDKTFQKLHGHRSVKEVTWKDVSDGKGFASEILRCILTFVDSINPTDIYTTVLKLPGFDRIENELSKQLGDEKKVKEMVSSLNDIHYFECCFYNKLAPILDVPIPKVFKTLEWIAGKQDGCIHMEDLTTHGKVISFFEDVNLTQVKALVRHLAHMHKNILSCDPKIWQGKYIKNREIGANFVDMIKPMIEPFLKNSKREGLCISANC